MRFVVRDFYKARVALLNCGDKFSMGPLECAFAVNKLVKPKTSIPTHIREEATVGGVVVGGSKTETFIDAAKRNVIVPLSGTPIMCNSKGRCTQ
jgi:L-ascorbate metabolism protein UlaG (beta-lactamase superfamily)